MKTTVKFIQAITTMNVEEIAKSINYTRAYLNQEMNKKDNNPVLEKLLLSKYRDQMEAFFEEKSYLLQEPGESSIKEKLVDAEEQLVHDSLIIKGMLRVVLRNQAAIIADQTGADASAVLHDMTEAVRAETQDDFAEL